MTLRWARRLLPGILSYPSARALAQGEIDLTQPRGRSGEAVTGGAATFVEAFRLLGIWLASERAALSASLLLLWLLACLVTWGLGVVTSVRPRAAAPLGTLIAFLLWGVGLVYWTLIRPRRLEIATLPWQFWFTLGAFAAIIVIALLVSWGRRRPA